MSTDKLRVIQWGTGYVGTASLQYILANPRLDLIGVLCHTAQKEGRTAGELAGFEAKGVNATRDRDAMLELAADCVLFMPRDAQADPSLEDSPSRAWVPDLLAILRSGKNVVSPIGCATHWRHMARGARFRDEVADACAAGGSTVYFTGFDPGFVTDLLAFTLSSMVGNIRQIRTWEVIDYGAYPVESTLHQLGLGVRPENLGDTKSNYRAVWGGAIEVLGDAHGIVIEDIRIEQQIHLATESYRASGGVHIEAGTVAAFMFSVQGVAFGRPVIEINHVTRMGQHVAPQWPLIGRDGGYRIEIDGFPPFRGEFIMGMDGGTGSSFGDAMTMTAARCVNSIETVVRAPPGVRTFLDLPIIGGKFV